MLQELLVSLATHGRPPVWLPGIGDPTVMGWVIVGGYFAAAMLCVKRFTGVVALGEVRKRARALALWACLAGMLLLLGVNKQLDLQTWLTRFGRNLAAEQGWYDQRRLVQVIFVTVLTAGLIGAGSVIATRLRDASRSARLALLGAAFLGGYVIVRAASLHHVDALLTRPLAGTKLNLLLELGGIACIALAASGMLTRRRRKTAPVTMAEATC